MIAEGKKYYYDNDAIKTYGLDPKDDIRRISKATLNGKSTPTEQINGIRKSSKNKSYHNPNNPKYNAIPDERRKDQFNGRDWGIQGKANKRSVWDISDNTVLNFLTKEHPEIAMEYLSSITDNKTSVWPVSTKPFPDAHFATFPEELIEPCIKAGCPKGGTVLDPFTGSGTTPSVAAILHRNYIGFELQKNYKPIYEKRITQAKEISQLGYAKTELNNQYPTLF